MQARLVIPVDRKPILTVDYYVIGEGGEELLARGQRESFPEFSRRQLGHFAGSLSR